MANKLNFNNAFLHKIKQSFTEIIQSKLFLYSFIALTYKTILFILLISDDMANGIKWDAVFFSVPQVLVYGAFFCIILSFGYLFKKKFHLISFSIMNILVTTLYIGDIWYFRSNKTFLNYHMFNYTSNLNNLSESILAMFRWVDVLFILDLIIIIFFSIKLKDNYKEYKRNLMSFVLLFFVPIIYLSYVHVKVDKLKMCYPGQYAFRGLWNKNQIIQNLSPVGYHIFDLYSFYEQSQPYELTASERTEANEWFNNKYEDLPNNEFYGKFKGKNLIVLQVESLENFVINSSIDGNEITPNLNKLLKNSLYFNNFYEQTHNGTTSDAELITNTSVFPVRSGSTFFRYPANEYKNSLPNIMERAGYSTTASHPDKGSYWNWLPALKSIGYDTCLDSSSFTGEYVGLGLSDASFLQEWIKVIDEQPKPSLSYGITATSHSPFDIPEKDKNLNLGIPDELINTSLGKYLTAINYTDKHIGLFIDELDKKGLLENSVVVLYGDHEGVTKFFKDEMDKLPANMAFANGNDRRVPLLIYSKDIKGQKIETIGGHADTLPTLAYLFGIPKEEYAYTSVGRNLLNTNKNYTVLSTREIRSINMSEAEEAEMLKALDLSDKLIRANYFK